MEGRISARQPAPIVGSNKEPDDEEADDDDDGDDARRTHGQRGCRGEGRGAVCGRHLGLNNNGLALRVKHS